MTSPPKERWIIGYDPEMKVEYLVHRHTPRFVAEVISDGQPPKSVCLAGAGQTLAKEDVDASEDTLRIVEWVDTRPGDPEITQLLRQGMMALAIKDKSSAQFLGNIQ